MHSVRGCEGTPNGPLRTLTWIFVISLATPLLMQLLMLLVNTCLRKSLSWPRTCMLMSGWTRNTSQASMNNCLPCVNTLQFCRSDEQESRVQAALQPDTAPTPVETLASWTVEHVWQPMQPGVCFYHFSPWGVAICNSGCSRFYGHPMTKLYRRIMG